MAFILKNNGKHWKGFFCFVLCEFFFSTRVVRPDRITIIFVMRTGVGNKDGSRETSSEGITFIEVRDDASLNSEGCDGDEKRQDSDAL